LKLVGRVPRASVAQGELVQLAYPPWHVLVALVRGEPCAIEDSCNHAGASLSEGTRDGDCVLCPMHGYLFALESGTLVAPKGLCENQRRLVAVIEGEDIVVWDPVQIRIEGGPP
jgi:nitrite reductase/ring-hydroxylating ferredoxin subunit